MLTSLSANFETGGSPEPVTGRGRGETVPYVVTHRRQWKLRFCFRGNVDQCAGKTWNISTMALE